MQPYSVEQRHVVGQALRDSLDTLHEFGKKDAQFSLLAITLALTTIYVLYVEMTLLS